jgi:hypothetical protein
MKMLSTIVAGSAVSALLLSGFAFSQQQQSQQQYGQDRGQQVGGREARQFMSQIERDVNQMVKSGDLSRLRQWTQNNVAEHAVLNRTNAIETEGHSRIVSSITITKPDLLRLQRFVLSGLSDKLNNVEDYQLNIQVQNVESIGDSAAIVKSRVSERATLMMHRGEGGRFGQRDSEQREGQRDRERDFTTGQGPRSDMQSGEDDEGQSRRNRPTFRGQQGNLQVDLQANCTHLVERNRDSGRLQIGMGVCDATTEAQL